MNNAYSTSMHYWQLDFAFLSPDICSNSLTNSIPKVYIIDNLSYRSIGSFQHRSRIISGFDYGIPYIFSNAFASLIKVKSQFSRAIFSSSAVSYPLSQLPLIIGLPCETHRETISLPFSSSVHRDIALRK